MPWTQLTINATDTNSEQISDLLFKTGAVSVTFQDAQDKPIFEPLPGETPLWGSTHLVALYEVETNLLIVLEQLKHPSILGEHFSYHIEEIADKNWEREWMNDFYPMQFGQRLWICPSWCDVPDPHAANVLLDPGLAFGTGTHPTTALCLEWLDSLDLTHKTIIDFGCGSGILAIAALKLGAKHAIGIDIDPQAIEASLENAKKNHVTDQLTLYLAKDCPKNITADVVIANILAGPLKELSSVITQFVAPNGIIGLSGVLTTQAQAVTTAYQENFIMDQIVTRDEWCRITGSRER